MSLSIACIICGAKDDTCDEAVHCGMGYPNEQNTAPQCSAPRLGCGCVPGTCSHGNDAPKRGGGGFEFL